MTKPNVFAEATKTQRHFYQAKAFEMLLLSRDQKDIIKTIRAKYANFAKATVKGERVETHNTVGLDYGLDLLKKKHPALVAMFKAVYFGYERRVIKKNTAYSERCNLASQRRNFSS